MVINSLCGEASASYNVGFIVGPPKPDIFVVGPNVWILACTNDSAVDYAWYYNGVLVPEAKDPIYVANQELGEYWVKISDESGCYANSDHLSIPLVSDQNMAIHDSKLSIYPNPSNGKFRNDNS